jgi:hypothetical protein
VSVNTVGAGGGVRQWQRKGVSVNCCRGAVAVQRHSATGTAGMSTEPKLARLSESCMIGVGWGGVGWGPQVPQCR